MEIKIEFAAAAAAPECRITVRMPAPAPERVQPQMERTVRDAKRDLQLVSKRSA